MANLLYGKKRLWKYLIISFVTCHCIIFYIAFFIPFTTHAAGTETISMTEDVPRNDEKVTPYTDAVLQEEFEAECLWLACDKTAAIATRQEIPVSKAPSIVTIITGEEIKHSGYRSLAEILRTVTGFAILKDQTVGDNNPFVRGVVGANKIKVMLNGHTVNEALTGSAFDRFDDFPVENIKKLEIIRGPGSAMYGENAFLAVINIITFDAKDIDGIKIVSGYGSFDTYEEDIVFGSTYKKVDISGMAYYRQTSGFDGKIESDLQSMFDNAFGTNASLAPGSVDDGRQEFGMGIKTAYKDFLLHGWYNNRKIGPFIGVASSLNDETDIESNYVFGEFGYKKTFEEKITVRPRIYYDQHDKDSYFEVFPEGASLDGTSFFPDGQIVVLKGTERIVGTEIPFDYTLFDKNTVTLGFEYRLTSLSNNRFLANYDQETGQPLSSLRNFSDSHPYINDATRRLLSFYLQDTWDVTDTLNLTIGVRHDRYNDFDNATSPRAGVTWSFIENASLKLLYGEAFRPPSFYELNVTDRGNKNLNPETVRTYEIELQYAFKKHITSSISYFYNDIEDLISVNREADVQRYENITSAQVQGIEIETRIDIKKGNYVFMNYAFLDTKDNHGSELPFAAKHKGNFGINVQYGKHINTNLNTFISGKRSRTDTDTRDDLPPYALTNLSIIGKQFFRTVEVQGTVYNLLDKDYDDPGYTSIPDDLPRPGRTFFVGLSYQF